MSYDISITVKTVDGVDIQVFETNITYNVQPMLQAAGLCKSLNDFNGKECRDLLPQFHRANMRLHYDLEGKVEALEAKNGWGTFEQLVPWFDRLHAAVLTHPSGKIEVS